MTSVEKFQSLSNSFNACLRSSVPDKLVYVILVPTLRCNLSCTYCQVSRANENAKGYDWNRKTLEDTINYICTNGSDDIKIEFQGGEPSLRLDLVKEVIEQISNQLLNPSFVICSNLQKISTEFLDLLKRPDVHLSCSLDGPKLLHQKNRTKDHSMTDEFFSNLEMVIQQFGHNKISLLTTISDFSTINEIVDFYYGLEIPEIFLRPVNFQGFARKNFESEAKDLENWHHAYKRGLEYIFQRNELGPHKLTETTFTIHLSKFFNPGQNGYVDLRTPNPLGKDYIVVDYDGALYPTDEARMISRSGLIDLKVGTIGSGLDQEKLEVLNRHSSNEKDVHCMSCRHQTYCGVDNIDNISRYGTIDIPKIDTYFCNNHMFMFDLVRSKIGSTEPRDIRNLAIHLTGFYKTTTLFRDWHND